VGNRVGFQPTRLVEGLGAAADRDEFLDPVAGAAGLAPVVSAITQSAPPDNHLLGFKVHHLRM
jgi:hypothetical protein